MIEKTKLKKNEAGDGSFLTKEREKYIERNRGRKKKSLRSVTTLKRIIDDRQRIREKHKRNVEG